MSLKAGRFVKAWTDLPQGSELNERGLLSDGRSCLPLWNSPSSLRSLVLLCFVAPRFSPRANVRSRRSCSRPPSHSL